MQLQLSFATLLAGVLFALSTVQDAAARPMKRSPGTVTLPLKRVPRAEGIPPTIYLQQHINRAHKRLARMKKREVPSDLQLRQNIERRMLALEESPLSKRFNRQGVKKNARSTNRIGLAGAPHSPRSLELKKSKGGNGAAGQAAAATATGDNGTAGTGSQIEANGVPSGVEAANAPTASNSLGLNIEGQDVGYLATIQMGTPPQDFLILMDSGSADLWVGSESCQSTAGGGCGSHTFLGTASSSTFQDSGKQFAVTYGTGNVAGTIITDNIAVAGLNLTGHQFGVADQESDDFADNSVPFDGLMGLAQSSLSEQGVPTPPESLASAGLISDAITSFKISREADDLNDGEITFGGLDATKFDASTLTTFDNVNTDGFWEGAMDSVTVDGTDTQLTGRTAILDTGTTLIVAPPDDATAVHQLIQGSASDGQGGFTVPCTTNASVALSFGNTAFAIDPRDIAFQPVDPNDPTGDCISGISSGEIGAATEWLVGDVFLKNAYFSVDVGNNAISLAKLV
ncbi:acid protease [Lentinula detonsa]|uniref:Acid protease n=1 Tax=Lentinula detonsa TaxID=2804962 RepID=A0A9W8NZW1_9AGAR|nr:acid protease [Lentinula detonsa]KAJ3990157.1 acid protease [Lentinula detonsa]